MPLAALLFGVTMRVHWVNQLWRDWYHVHHDLEAVYGSSAVRDDQDFFWQTFWGADILGDVCEATIQAEYEFEFLHLKCIPNVRSLTVYAGSYRSDGVQLIETIAANCPRLTRLALIGATLSDEDRERLSNLRGLKELELDTCNILDNELKQLLAGNQFEKLRIIDCEFLTGDAFETLADQEQLRELSIQHSHEIIIRH